MSTILQFLEGTRLRRPTRPPGARKQSQHLEHIYKKDFKPISILRNI